MEEDHLRVAIDEGRVLFFAGSGVSVPSGMPSADEVRRQVCKALLPASERDRRYTQLISGTILPELLYQNLEFLTEATDHLRIWLCLEPNIRAEYGLPTCPNINHLFIVDYCARHGLPLFTTNFDTLFEAAACELGLKPSVIRPFSTCERVTAQRLLANDRPDRSRVVIFKVHDTLEAGSMGRLHSSLTTISCVNETVIGLLAKLAEARHICFAGYSGCDLDFFPILQDRKLEVRPVWIGKKLQKNRISRITQRHAEAIGADWIDSWPNELFERWRPNYRRPLPALARDGETSMFEGLRGGLSRDLAFGEAQKELLCGLCLHSLGRNTWACDIFRRIRIERWTELAVDHRLLLLAREARALDCVSRYREALATAKNLKRLSGAARRSGRRDLGKVYKLHAGYQKLMARKQAVGPVLGFGPPALQARRPRLSDLQLLLCYLLTTWQMARGLRKDIQLAERGYFIENMKTDAYSPMLGSAFSKYLDQRVVIFDYLSHILQLVRGLAAVGLHPMRTVRGRRNGLNKGLSSYMQRTLLLARGSGDAFAIACLEKYGAYFIDERQADRALETFALFHNYLNRSIVLRNRAERRLELGRTDKAGRDFLYAYLNGLKSGSTSEQLKALIGLRACGVGGVDRRLRALQGRISGKGYEIYLARSLNFIRTEAAA